MYVRRWHAGAVHPSLAAGMRQLLGRCTIERDWAHWKQDAAWLTPYFTVCVWLSIALAHVPSLTRSS
jgi:hypothetical protein